jgi:hypothetical protein
VRCRSVGGRWRGCLLLLEVLGLILSSEVRRKGKGYGLVVSLFLVWLGLNYGVGSDCDRDISYGEALWFCLGCSLGYSVRGNEVEA